MLTTSKLNLKTIRTKKVETQVNKQDNFKLEKKKRMRPLWETSIFEKQEEEEKPVLQRKEMRIDTQHIRRAPLIFLNK